MVDRPERDNIEDEETETELPDEVDDVDENMFPSAPADRDGRIL